MKSLLTLPCLSYFICLSISKSKQVWLKMAHGKQCFDKGTGHSGDVGRWLRISLISPGKDLLNLTVAGFIISCPTALYKRTPKGSNWTHKCLKEHLGFVVDYSGPLGFLSRGTFVQWKVLDVPGLCSVWSCHQHMCLCHPVDCTPQIRAAIQPRSKPFTIAIIVCLDQRQTCNVQRRSGAFTENTIN